MIGIFSGTPENMVICINETNAKKMNNQIMTTKGCSIVNCSENWIESRKKVRASDNKCVEICSIGYKYLYESKCYESCPEGTFSVDYVCKKNLTDEDECKIKYFFLGKCVLQINNQTEKQKFIESVNKGIMNLDLYELLLSAKNEKKVHTIHNQNEIYQIYSISNKIRVPGTTYINLDECGDILKEKHNLNKNEDLIVFKIEYHYPEFKIPIIEYQIFSENGVKKLNLNHCKDIKIHYYIPKEITNYEEYKYDPENNYYNDKCLTFKINEPTDIVLYDRKDEFNQNNMSLCENLCKYKGYINNNIKCECEVKLKFNSFLNDNSDKYNLIYRFEVKKTNANNFWIIKCFLDNYIRASLLFNGITYFILVILGITIIGVILFRAKEYKQFHKNIHILVQTAIIIKTERGELNEEESEISDKEEEDEINEKNSDNNDDNDEVLKNGIKGEEKEIDLNYDNDYEKNKKKLKDEILRVKENKIVFTTDDKDSVINFKKPKKNFVPGEKEGYLQNKIISEKKSDLEKSNNDISDSINELIIDNKIKKTFLEKTKVEWNNLSYKEAKKEDKRTFFQFYFSLIKTKHILFLPFRGEKDYNSRIINICNLLFVLVIYLTINTMFVDESSIHNIYISKGKFDFSYNVPKIVLATFLIYILQVLYFYAISLERITLEIKGNVNKNFFKRVNNVMNIIIVKIFITFSINILLLVFSWLYIGCFTSIFPKTKMHLIKITIISFSISIVIPLVIFLLISSLRIFSLKKENRKGLYQISQLLQIL